MTGKIRIIGGQWRGRRLAVPDRPGLRPTGDRVRETLFNWLQPHIVGANCLDLFAGTGALGLEAASRGAARVVLVERDRALAEGIRTAQSWPAGERVEMACDDVIAWLGRCMSSFDIVFLDPPFGAGLQARTLDLLLSRQLLEVGALVYVEQAIDEPSADDDRFETLRDKQLGRVRARLLRQLTDGSV